MSGRWLAETTVTVRTCLLGGNCLFLFCARATGSNLETAFAGADDAARDVTASRSAMDDCDCGCESDGAGVDVSVEACRREKGDREGCDWACWARHDDCCRQAEGVFSRAWRMKGRISPSSDMTVVFCAV